MSTTTSIPSTIFTKTKTLANGGRLVVEVRMDDECHNGHADFAVTATEYNAGGRDVCGGCMHEEVLKHFPKLAPLVALHLHEAMSGAAMHAIANGFYFYELALGRQKGDKPPETYKKYVQESYFLTDAETAALFSEVLEDQACFQYYLETKGITKRWAKKAAEGRALLFSLMGDPAAEAAKWEGYKPTRSGYTPMPAKAKKEMKARIASGYYTAEAKAQRAAEAAQAEQDKALAAIEKEHAETLQKATDARLVERALVLVGAHKGGWIHYTRTNTLAANWASYAPVSEAEYLRVVEALKAHELPKGMKFSRDTEGR
jgi:hypothetical protein